MLANKLLLPNASNALPGRSTPMQISEHHAVNGHSMIPPYPPEMSQVSFGMGCFWGPEKKFWETPGVFSTSVGYAGGITPNPTYEEVCSGLTGHTEVVKVVFDPAVAPFEQLLILFWESHDPTQGMRQGVDVGTQYRSAVYVGNETDFEAASASKQHYQERLTAAGFGAITTEIFLDPLFYFAEDYHQQFVAKNPGRPTCENSCSYSGKPTYRN